LDASGLGYEKVAGSCEHRNEPSHSINGGEFLDWLNDYQLLKKDYAPLTLRPRRDAKHQRTYLMNATVG
jgi:hypothetical protein